MSTVLVVTDKTLGEQEIENIRIAGGAAADPRGDADPGSPAPTVRLLVPAQLHQPQWMEFLDRLTLLQFSEAADVFSSSEKGPQTLEAEAQEILDASLEVLRGAGLTASGRTSTGDPVEAMAEEIRDGATQALIITDPHPVQDTFNIGWSNTAEKTLGVPVLHLYWGTGHVDD